MYPAGRTNKGGRKEGSIHFLIFLYFSKEMSAEVHITTLIRLSPSQYYSYQSTADHTAAAAEVERLVVEAGIRLEPGTAGTPDLKMQK